MPATVLVDAENVRRSVWPNIPAGRLAELAAEWGRRHGARVVPVFDGPAPAAAGPEAVGSGPGGADDAIVELAEAEPGPLWLVTSDRLLRERVGGRAERVVGGGTFARELLAL